ncbi:hypothetical protein FHR83_008797 [Actinoplanes campanulatus]|uniref:Uncharacterized protein n=1 Tax=Actinoplanes campanulatus TaxID=113559 RepID=A0A7W5AS96_9ACTN|nr:hypothetical protein [Actinoplanes campanulatus]MBB3101069.1 hypothetical protein [Actinoplanes campanulatus]GGN49476.1 hypothetical protein GCM10010109_87610 [Actinoplanes campanulatus]GID41840.1 hypothetical protein Aca09nite_83460 [Actinoplanes campanulatus]
MSQRSPVSPGAARPGTYRAVRDGVPANTPEKSPARTGPGDLTGNFVIQNLGGGAYALYAHLNNGSVRVRSGQYPLTGDVIDFR